MLHRKEYLGSHPEVHTGMAAYTVDDEKLGKVATLDEDSVVIEKGFFFPKDFTIRYDDILDVRDDHLIVRERREELGEWRNEQYPGWNEYDQANRQEEARMPVREEQLKAEKRRHEGEVHLRKVVHTEMRHMKVPVQKEEVIVERTPTDKEYTPEPGDRPFHEEEMRIPVAEEEVEVTKRPVIKEEVRARKERRTEEQDVSGEVRKEDVEVEEDKPGRRSRRR